MATLKARHNRFEAKVRVPQAMRSEHEDREFLYLTIKTADRRAARAEAAAWEASLRATWAEKAGHGTPQLRGFRAVYERVRHEVTKEACAAAEGDPLRAAQGVAALVDQMAADEPLPPAPLSEAEEARLAALQDAEAALLGQEPKARPELERTFSELADEYLAWWKRQSGLKETNTEQQKRATFALFGGFWRDKPIRAVRRPDAVRFMDHLRRLDPRWGRSPGSRGLPWGELLRRFGESDGGPSDATLNRHAATLRALWEWAADRDRCEGRNPFAGHHRKLRTGVNVTGYLPWDTEELRRLFDPPPRRADLREVMLVALFTGMRLDEIASLRWGQLRDEEGVTFIQVEDAKTPAGNRQVPLHPQLSWLKDRRETGAASARVWPLFNPEGPGKKPGADAGRDFSRFKQSRGFTDRRKVFHSFRKNVTKQMERAGVPENEWAQVFGHEKGFTYGRYNPHGITLERKAQIIGFIAYPEVALPHPEQ